MQKYRTEIDGLRAFAVLPVILHHAFPELLPGGFVGVDIFFVISGYLITGILMNEISTGRLSILEFYERRARRILPALLVVLTASTVCSWLLLSNSELIDFLESLSGAALFYSNFVFWDQTDYFGVEAIHKPLLHTWSLAIEEQFYIIFPFLLLITWKFLRERLWIPVLLIALLSFYLSYRYSAIYPTASFYLLHTRFWELAIGALIALGFNNGELRGPNWMGWLGVLMILTAVFLITKDMAFPGSTALVPTLGAAFVLVGARDGNGCSRFLSLAPFVWMGLISYSAYLWHQPVLVFGRRFFLNEMPTTVALCLILLSILFAFVSWRFVEKPFRNRSFLTRRLVLTSSASILLAIVLVANTALEEDLGLDRVTAAGHSTRWLEEFTKPNYGLGRNCDKSTEDVDEACSFGIKPDYILWGDSYAMHLAQAMVAGEISFKQMTMSACAPIVGIAPFTSRYGLDWGEGCFSHNDRAINEILESDITRVVLSSPFGVLTDTTGSWNIRGSVVPSEEAMGFESLIETIEILQSNERSVVIVSPMPRPPFSAADCMIQGSFLGKSFDHCNFERSIDRRQAMYEALQRISDESGAKVVYLSDLVCDEELCFVEINGIPLYRDSSHLPPAGSTALGEHTNFVDALTRAFQISEARMQ